MPYIEKTRRQALNNKMICPDTGGDLNYLSTILTLKWETGSVVDIEEILYQLGLEFVELKGQSYKTYNDIIGAFTCCRLEYGRRYHNDLADCLFDSVIQRFYSEQIAPYEDKKIKENGDVGL